MGRETTYNGTKIKFVNWHKSMYFGSGAKAISFSGNALPTQ